MPSEDRNLAGITLLQGLDPEARAALEGRCAWRRYRPGERVFERGSAGREVFFVIHGALNVVSVSPLGREITFAAAQSGGMVGEMAAIDGQPRSASVVAVEESLVAVLPSEAFIALLESHGEIALHLLRQLSAFVRQSGNRVLELSAVKAVNRVYGELLRLAEPDEAAPDLWAIKPLPALRDLASQAGTTREVVASALSKLYPSGLIRRKGTSLYILDRQALEEIVKAAAGSTAED
jgi:CRP/FNR family cyclic AMP-dependent transcriptional regulator